MGAAVRVWLLDRLAPAGVGGRERRGRGAAAAAVGRALHRAPGRPASSVDFGRMFPGLPPFADANDTVRAALLEVGMPGGIMDAGDDLAAGPKALIVDPTVNGNPTATDPYGTNPDNPTMTAGLDVRRPVHRPRHHLRPDLAARRAAEPADLAQHPHPGARPRLGVRRRPGTAPGPVRRQPGRVGRARS